MSPAMVELAFQWLLYMSLSLSLLRWPGRTFGVGLALVLYTVWGPWATWATLAVVVVGSLVWKRSGYDAGVGLLAYPQWAAIVLGAAFALLGRGVVSAAGFVVVAAMSAWMLGGRFAGRRESRLPAVVGNTAGGSGAPEWPPPGRRFLGRGSWIVDFAPCEQCGSLTVASGRLESDPSAIVARSVCTGCGARMVGMEDPTTGQLVWWLDLSPEAREDIA